MIELGKLLIDSEKAEAFSAWLDMLVTKRRQERARVQAERERDEQNEAYYNKLVAVARSCADDHGHVTWMDAYTQANAAYEAWDAGAGYFDIDEHFQLDAEWKESWVNAYVSRIEDIARARTADPGAQG